MSKNYNENVFKEGALQNYKAVSKNKTRPKTNNNDNDSGVKTENWYDKILKDTDEKIKNLEARILLFEKESINKIIQIISIFIGFFTFISVEMQIFKNVTNWILATSLSLILLGSILFFVTVINLFFNSSEGKNNFRQIIMAIFGFVFIASGIWAIYIKEYHNDDYVLNKDLDNYYKKEELRELLNEKNHKIDDILKCISYSNGFWEYKECAKP